MSSTQEIVEKSEYPSTVFKQYRTVQHDGRVNMLDYHGVMKAADDLRCHALVVAMDDMGSQGYGAFLFGEMSDYIVASDQEAAKA